MSTKSSQPGPQTTVESDDGWSITDQEITIDGERVILRISIKGLSIRAEMFRFDDRGRMAPLADNLP